MKKSFIFTHENQYNIIFNSYAVGILGFLNKILTDNSTRDSINIHAYNFNELGFEAIAKLSTLLGF